MSILTDSESFLQHLHGVEEKLIAHKTSNGILQQLNVSHRQSSSYSKESYIVDEYYQPVDGELTSWVKDKYESAIVATGLSIDNITGLSSTREQVQQQSNIENDVSLSMMLNITTNIDYSFCSTGGDTNNHVLSRDNFDSYWRCEHTFENTRVRFSEYLFRYSIEEKNLYPGYPSPVIAYVSSNIVYLLTPIEYHHMPVDLRLLMMSDVPDLNADTMEIYCSMKHIFCLYLNDYELYLAWKGHQRIGLPWIRSTIQVVLTKIGGIMPVSWLKFWIYTPNVLHKRPELLNHLSEKEKNHILSSVGTL